MLLSKNHITEKRKVLRDFNYLLLELFKHVFVNPDAEVLYCSLLG